MKKNTLKIVLVALVCIIVVGCTNRRDKGMFAKDNQIKFDTLNIEKRHFLHNDTTNPSCNLDVHFVYPIQSRRIDLQRLEQLFVRSTLGRMYEDKAPKEALDEYVNNFVKNYEADARVFHKESIELENHPTLIPQNLDEVHENELQSNEFYTYYESLSNKIHFNQSSLLSFQVKQSNNKGGSTTYSSYSNFVINLKDNSILNESDIFVPGYDVALQQLFANSLMQQNNVSNISDLEDLGYFGIEEIMPNRNFLIDEKGITYTFNRGEYSAYPLNAPVVFISFNDLRMLLKENTIVSKLAGL